MQKANRQQIPWRRILPPLILFFLAEPVWPANVLVLQSGDAATDSQVQKLLQDRGHTVTMGPNSADFTGKQVSLSSFDVTLILAHAAVYAPGLTPDGQAAMVSYLYGGGRVITTEPINESIANSGSALRLLLPAQRDDNTNTPGSTTFAQSEPDALLNDGVSASFALNLSVFGYLEAFPDAHVYYTTRLGYPGVIGRILAGGARILSFATPASVLELQNNDYRQLLGNAINWATVPAPAPVKTSNPARVLLLQSGTPDWDNEVQRALQEAGHTVTAGPAAVDFTGKQANMAAYDVTLIVPSGVNFVSPVFQPDGITAIQNYIAGGGKVVTAEPFNRGISNSSPFRLLYPVSRLSNSNTPGRTTFAQSDVDPVIDAGVSQSFTFDIDSQGYFELTADSKTYFTSRAGGPGLAGRTLGGGGRVLCFATPLGPLELQNADFRRLVANSIAWAKGSSAVTAPTLSSNPASLTFTYTSGGTVPSPQTLAISASGTAPASFSVTSSSTGNWVAATPPSGATPGNLTVSVSPAALPPGNYSGEVVVTGGLSPLHVPIALSVATATTNSCTYQISPLVENFPLAGGSGTIGVSTQTGCAWTALSNSSFVSVTSGASGSGPGTVTYSVAAYTGAQSRVGSLTIAGRQFSVNQSGSTLSFIAGPSPLSFRFTQGAAAPVESVIYLQPSASGASFSLTVTGGSWLSATPASGALPGTILVTVNPAGLAPGAYKGTVSVHVPNASPADQTVQVNVTIDPAGPAQLVVETATINLTATQGSQPVSRNLQVRNGGSGSLVFHAAVSGGSWLSVQPANGTATIASPASIVVTGNPQGLDAGTYAGHLLVTPDSGDAIQIDVFMTVSASRQVMLLSQSGLTFTAVAQGGATPSQNFGILNTGDGVMDWSALASTLAGGSWLSVSPGRGVSDAASLDVPLADVNVNQAGLAPGEYHGLITVTSTSATNSPQLVSVLLRVLPAGSDPGPVVRPTGLIFTTNAASPSSSTQEVLVSNLSASPRTFTSARLTFDGAPWFTHLPVDATVVPAQPTHLLVQFNPAGLTPDVRRGVLTLLFGDGSVQTISVLSVVAPPASASPSALAVTAKGQSAATSTCGTPALQVQLTSLQRDFVAAVGQATTVAVKVVDECGRTLDKTGVVTARFSTNDPSVNLVSLGGGVWSGTWRPNGRADSASIEVTALVAASGIVRGGQIVVTGTVQDVSQIPLVKPGGVVQAASFIGGVPLAPGSLISVYGINLADSTGQAQSLPLPVQLNNVQVVLGDRSLPLLYTSSGQVNAQVPYDLPVNTQHQIAIRRGVALSVPDTLSVAAAQPGIFTASQTGSGQGSIYKTDLTTLVAKGAPASAGDTIVIYCSGLGAVDPAVPEGASAPSSPLAATVNPVTVRIGGIQAQVSFSGLTPGAVGLYQVNAVVPAVPAGDAVPVQIEVAGQVSPPVTMAIR
ncbi:MAG TPA: hypothetical protein VGH38_02510 [Bryobacteraceae bacterium]